MLLAVGLAQAAKISDVRATKHNLSASGGGSLKATSETQVCVFCHTPHAATAGIVAPLWNRELSSATYTNTYSSTSMEADADELAAGPGGSSKLCLSCHDGTMAIDKVNVLNGVSNPTIAMTAATTMPTGSGATTGFTRNLGADLSNDHPISFTYDSALATADGELRVPAAENTPDGIVMNRAVGKAKPVMPLENNQIQCATCHDPHLNDTVDAKAKFLRVNRLQAGTPSPDGNAFNQANDIICLACHTKAGWANSAHANSNVATQTYKEAAATLREFPLNTPVWKAACLNCHDTHTVPGARRLLREGTDGAGSPKAGGNPALEETCYQCHDGSTTVLNSVATVPNIKADFSLARHMPIKTSEQADGLTEVHDIGGVINDYDANCGGPNGPCGKDLLESRTKLGVGVPSNRHAECTDCHNPHRVIKGQNGLPGILTPSNTNEKAGTHRHENASGFLHTNIISGVLRGSWGVEPIYPNNSFQSMPSSFSVKRGDPASNGPIVTSRPASETFVTREYQICLKCHSNNGYSDDNNYPNGAMRPELGGPGLTPINSNGHTNFTRYTNQAKEFQAPLSHAVQIGSASLGTDGGAGSATARNNNNHRSWHPVMAPTGRTNRPANGFLAPWNNAGAVGNQTMYCSDCHGSNTDNGTAMPTGNSNTSENGQPWGPHGSNNNFLLKGNYNAGTGNGQADGLCFKCHSYSAYAGGGGGTGFQTSDRGDGHSVHADRIDSGIKCNYCHVAVPHGWKNRGLLVNLLDVGPEAGLAAGTAVSFSNGVGYSNGPYYRNAFLRVISFPSSGSKWSESSCNGGSKDTMRSNCENGP